jgi:hypothetical protein
VREEESLEIETGSVISGGQLVLTHLERRKEKSFYFLLTIIDCPTSLETGVARFFLTQYTKLPQN